MHQWKLILATLCLFPLQLQAADSQKVIAFAQDTLANDFRQAQVAEARAAAAQYADIKFVHSDAKGRTSLLIRQINQFVQNEVDALIIGTNDENAVVPAIQKAHDAGIKVIVLDRGVKTQSYTSFINSDNASIGRIAGEFIAKSLMEGPSFIV